MTKRRKDSYLKSCSRLIYSWNISKWDFGGTTANRYRRHAASAFYLNDMMAFMWSRIHTNKNWTLTSIKRKEMLKEGCFLLLLFRFLFGPLKENPFSSFSVNHVFPLSFGSENWPFTVLRFPGRDEQKISVFRGSPANSCR